jgi:hypothetical protein
MDASVMPGSTRHPWIPDQVRDDRQTGMTTKTGTPMKFDFHNPYPTTRIPVMARNVVSTSHPRPPP